MVRLLFLMVAGAAISSAQDNGRMEQIIQEYVSRNQFMGSVLVARGDQIVLKKGYGFANLEWEIPNAPNTKFRLGSVTKQFTAASILLLEEKGKLKTDDLVSKYMPDAPSAWGKVTIFNLLTHTSGIPSFTDFPDYQSTEAFATTPEKLVARFRDKPLEFQPGENWKYDNSGYVLLGYLVEKVSGKTYAQFVQENIFTPLGMKDSGYDSNSEIIHHRASGYSPGPTGPVNSGYINMTIPYSAGSLYSTTEDLLRWQQALFGGKILSAESLKKMITPYKQQYALGLGVSVNKGHKVIDHGGGIEGFNTHLAYYPDEKLTVVVLGNLNGMAPTELCGKLGAAALGEKVPLISEQKEITVSPQVLARYPGTYKLAPNFLLTITLESGQLMAQATGQEKYPLFAETDARFFYKIVDAQIDFEAGNAGTPASSLILHQNGQDLKATRQ